MMLSYEGPARFLGQPFTKLHIELHRLVLKLLSSFKDEFGVKIAVDVWVLELIYLTVGREA